MAEKRVSGWFVLSAVFVVLVFGLFFTFTERKSWPEHRMELGPGDMRLAPPVSTFWCESMTLHSDHSFVAYQVNHGTQISSKRLRLQHVNLRLKLGSTWSTSFMKLKYFLLPSSVVEIIACSMHPGVKLMVFKSDKNIQNCLQSLSLRREYTSNGYNFDEYSSEENGVSDTNFDYHTSEDSTIETMAYEKFCTTLISYHSMDIGYIDGMSCNPITQMTPIKLNITSADSYTIVAWNTHSDTNIIELQLFLDRSRYTVHHKSGRTFDLCSLAKSCTIGLDFATGDRVLVSIPEEPNSGRTNFVVRTRCTPRLAVFAVLSVFLPLLLFMTVAFVVKADKLKFGFICCKRQDSSRHSNRPRTVSPLLNTSNNLNELERADNSSEQIDELPPPYHTLYDPPPAYSCLKETDCKASPSR